MSLTTAIPKPRTVLVAECVEICSFLRTLLERPGCEVITTFSGGAAEAILADRPERFDLVITNKPEGLLRFGVPVIYIAALPDPALASRCAGVLAKPFFPAAMLNMITAVLGGRGMAAMKTSRPGPAAAGPHRLPPRAIAS